MVSRLLPCDEAFWVGRRAFWGKEGWSRRLDWQQLLPQFPTSVWPYMESFAKYPMQKQGDPSLALHPYPQEREQIPLSLWILLWLPVCHQIQP